MWEATDFSSLWLNTAVLCMGESADLLLAASTCLHLKSKRYHVPVSPVAMENSRILLRALCLTLSQPRNAELPKEECYPS